MKWKSPFLVRPDDKVKLDSLSTDTKGGFKDSDSAEAALEKHRKRASDLQELFYADGSRALLIVLQGMDTAGKDGTIRHIFSGLNPQGCDVASFKVPTPLEQRHDFLWRCHEKVPAKGMIGIFNRSHYEDVLFPRVHKQISHKIVAQRLRDINHWEQTLVDNGTIVLKFFLHISREEQTERLQARIDDPEKHWKLSLSDFEERRFWPEYMEAYEDILRKTSTADAPWFVIPSDYKWFRNAAISEVFLQTLEQLKMRYPTPAFDPKGLNLKTESAKQVAKDARQRANPEASVKAEQSKN